jgi:hypothetical protein
MSAEKKQRTCQIAGCTVQIANKLLMCPDHWRLCPKTLKSEVWRWYRAGQEKTGMVSLNYVDAARAAIAAVEKEERIARAAGIQTQPSLL